MGGMEGLLASGVISGLTGYMNPLCNPPSEMVPRTEK